MSVCHGLFTKIFLYDTYAALLPIKIIQERSHIDWVEAQKIP